MKCFISYRREDSTAHAGRLHANLSSALGNEQVFMDTSSMAPGEKWPAALSDALKGAESFIVLIGPNWIRASDEFGHRRIDQKGDWVLEEINRALNSGKALLPVLVGGASLPPKDALPESLHPLLNLQKVDIRDEYWNHDVQLVISRLLSFNSASPNNVRSDESNPYPVPPIHIPNSLNEEKLKLVLESSLQEWTLIVSPLPEDTTSVRQELYRSYEFESFLDTIRFMNKVAPGCEIAMHHPRWENIWRTLRVYLTTWDIDHKISDRDVQLAHYFDRAYTTFDNSKVND